MAFLGFSAGLPILLIFSSLSLWLREAGVERGAVTFFSWAALGYSFKFIWAPLVDRLDAPFAGRLLGRRRGWLLLAQLAVMAAIGAMASIDPAVDSNALTWMALAAVALGFSSATQDIIIDAYRIESAGEELQALMSSTYIAGYRIGMLLAGAGALYLAQVFGSTAAEYEYTAWRSAYLCMAGAMLIGVVTTLVISEPERANSSPPIETGHARLLLVFVIAVIGLVSVYAYSGPVAIRAKESLAQLMNNSALAALLVETMRLAAGVCMAWLTTIFLIKFGAVSRTTIDETYVEPIREFFARHGLMIACLLLAIIGLYRIADIVLGVVSNVFYQDLGYSKGEIATAVKTFGLFMTIAGGFLGGILSLRFGVLKVLLWGAILAAATNLLFMLLAQVGYDLQLLYVVVAADNLSAGLASAAFVAFLSSLTNVSFTAMQYALFSSLMTLLPKVLGGYSGTIVDSVGYSNFFAVSALLGAPVIVLIAVTAGKFQLAPPPNRE
jgi:MFS transporter, PAT family, beta-lactamase induction signal transducer AmpG